jgi:membrane-bound metal-dependent hydrolase YbcI (DUF457 family)
VPTPISHAAVGFAIAAWGQQPPPTRRVCLIAAACAALPDVDYLGWPVPHRSITHSLLFALVGALVAAAVFKEKSLRIATVLALAFLSHGLLDGLSAYSFGIEYLAPFSAQRYRLAWTPLGNSSGALGPQLAQEAIVVLLPAVVLAWMAFRVRRPKIATV